MLFKSFALYSILIVVLSSSLFSQKVGFINSQMIREKFPEAKQAEQRIQSMTDEWKRELSAMAMKIDNLDFEIKKNRLVWTETEKVGKDKELADLKKLREDNAKSTFEPGGKFDLAVKVIMSPIEEKIFASVQQIASDQGFDFILDQSVQAIPYVNYKYDMTIKVLKILGVETEDLEKELQQKIDADPRNAKKDSKTPKKKTSRADNDPNAKDTERDFEQKNPNAPLNPNSPLIPNDPKNPHNEPIKRLNEDPNKK